MGNLSRRRRHREASGRGLATSARAGGAGDPTAGGTIGGQQDRSHAQTRCADGRVRNMYQIYGAVTGRWSGDGFQPQNLKRPELLQTDEAIAEAIAMVLAGDYAAIKERYGDVLGLIGDLCRSMIDPGTWAPFHRRGFQRSRGARSGLPRRRRGQDRGLSPVRSRSRAGHLLRYG